MDCRRYSTCSILKVLNVVVDENTPVCLTHFLLSLRPTTSLPPHLSAAQTTNNKVTHLSMTSGDDVRTLSKIEDVHMPLLGSNTRVNAAFA